MGVEHLQMLRLHISCSFQYHLNDTGRPHFLNGVLAEETLLVRVKLYSRKGTQCGNGWNIALSVRCSKAGLLIWNWRSIELIFLF